jgi:hypothetical protein
LLVIFENLLQALCVLLCLFKMLLKTGSKLLVRRRLSHLRQRLHQLLFCAEKIL